MTATPFVAGPPTTTTDGVDIATYDLGGDGPTLILAHATGFHALVWLPLAAVLRERYHCVAFDARGHGHSGPAPDANYDWAGFGRDVLAVAAAWQAADWQKPRSQAAGGGRRPLAVGHSCGGAALLLAEEAEPGTFGALYCYEPVVPISNDGTDGSDRPADPDDNPLARGARRRRRVFTSRGAALDHYGSKAAFASFDPAALEAYVEWGFHDLPDGTVELACEPEVEARIYEAAWDNQSYRHLERVTCPVTLAAGGANAHFGVDVVEAVAQRTEGPATVEIHEDLGHFGPLERPAEIATAIFAAFDGPRRPAPTPGIA